MMLDDLKNILGSFKRTFRLGNGRPDRKERKSDAGIVPFVTLPTVQRAMQRPAQRATSMFSFKDVDRRVVLQKRANQGKVAVPCCVMQRRLVVVEDSIR